VSDPQTKAALSSEQGQSSLASKRRNFPT
jgi:hypothetical protein